MIMPSLIVHELAKQRQAEMLAVAERHRRVHPRGQTSLHRPIGAPASVICRQERRRRAHRLLFGLRARLANWIVPNDTI